MFITYNQFDRRVEFASGGSHGADHNGGGHETTADGGQLIYVYVYDMPFYFPTLFMRLRIRRVNDFIRDSNCFVFAAVGSAFRAACIA